MEDFFEGLFTILAIIVLIILGIVGFLAIFCIPALILWGVGYFVCWAFAIPFLFTFWHGLAVELILMVIGGLFKVEVNIKK